MDDLQVSGEIKKPMFRRAIYSAISIGAGILLALVLAEVILRVAPGLLPVELQQFIQADPRNYGVPHPYIGHLHKPNNALVISGRDYRAVLHTDGYGFRNPWPWPKSAEIITLGDSLTFGHGVEDEQAWPAILARSFPSTRVINLGLAGAAPQQYLRVYETFGLKLGPKLVLVGFFMGNDFWDAEMFDLWLKSGAGGSYMVWRDFGRSANTSLSTHQPIRNLVSSLVWRAKLFARKSYLCNLLIYFRDRSTTWAPFETRTFQAPNGTRLELAVGIFGNNTRNARPGHRPFQLVLETLQGIQSLAKQNGATALVVFQPSKEEVYLPLLGEPAPDPGAPLRAALAELGMPYLDLLPEFRRHAAQGEVLFFERDGHPNARGYALIAQLVSSHLRQYAKEYGL